MAFKALLNGSYGQADESQQIVRCARIEFGPSADTGKGVVYTTTGVKKLFTIPANGVLLDAKARIIEAFATGQAIIIGDTKQTDGLFTTAKLAPATAVTTGILKANSVSDYFNATGFLGGYAVQAALAINLTQSATGATKTFTTGKGELFLVYACNGDD